MGMFCILGHPFNIVVIKGRNQYFVFSVELLWWNIPPEMQEKLLLRQTIFFAMSLIIKLTLALTLNDPHDDA